MEWPRTAKDLAVAGASSTWLGHGLSCRRDVAGHVGVAIMESLVVPTGQLIRFMDCRAGQSWRRLRRSGGVRHVVDRFSG